MTNIHNTESTRDFSVIYYNKNEKGMMPKKKVETNHEHIYDLETMTLEEDN